MLQMDSEVLQELGAEEASIAEMKQAVQSLRDGLGQRRAVKAKKKAAADAIAVTAAASAAASAAANTAEKAVAATAVTKSFP